MSSSTGGSGSKKYGRNLRKPTCKRYTHEMRWIKNKARKLVKHIKKHPKDLVALNAYQADTV